MREVLQKVSIPVWFDWEDNHLARLQFANRFQFQYGSIGSEFTAEVIETDSAFQFQYGSIGRES